MKCRRKKKSTNTQPSDLESDALPLRHRVNVTTQVSCMIYITKNIL